DGIYSLTPTPAACDGDEVFNGVPDDCVLYVPAGAETDYGEYSSSYTYTWNSFKKIRTFHTLDISIVEADTVNNHISGYGYTTYYNGKYAYTLPTGMKATTITNLNDNGIPTLGWEYDGDDTKKAVIPANTAVVIYGNIDNYMLMVDYDETATNTDKYGVISSDGIVPDVNFLHGCWDTSELYTDNTYTEGVTYAYDENGDKTVDGYVFYILNFSLVINGVYGNIGFYWAATDGKPFAIEAKKAWLAIPGRSASSEYFGIAYGEDSLTSGIRSIDTNAYGQSAVNDDRIYNLSGQRVSNMSRGNIYIVNGKKVVCK
ncbi:MAG: hypothetical protein LUD50_08250, partial [Clostridia bacterium]|nr:hypothetical protein [Clostridia bacterium]